MGKVAINNSQQSFASVSMVTCSGYRQMALLRLVESSASESVTMTMTRVVTDCPGLPSDVTQILLGLHGS